MATYSTLLFAKTNSVLTITLNRPESHNALNEAEAS
jgi:enoyl-CoA hydratase/carnithine racemase